MAKSTQHIEDRPYFEAVEEFLKEIQGVKISTICMVALCDDSELHNITSYWNAGPYDLSAAANVLQLDAAIKFVKANNDELDDDEEGDEDEDCSGD